MRAYLFGDFELDLDAGELRRDGAPVRLERRPLDLLELLVSRHGRLVGREEIVGKLWPGNVIIDFDSGLNTLVRKVRHALGDSPDHPRFIVTVPGRGYRFVAPVTERTDGQPAAGAVPAATPAGSAWPKLALASAILLVAIVGVIVWQFLLHEPAPTRIAVLPFENLTGDDEYDYLASGLAEETSTTLSRIDLPDLRVIGGVSARVIAGSDLTLKQVGRELDVDFAVLSSLRIDGTRLRVMSRLVRVADSEQMWSASFDRELINVLDLQRELSVAIAEQVRQRLSPDVAAAIARRQTANPDAYALFLRGREQWNLLSQSSLRRALGYYEQAAEADPTYALAWAGIAHVSATSLILADANPADAVPKARDALSRALDYGAELAEVQYAKAYVHMFVDWDLAAAEETARHAIALDPNSAIAYMLLGMVLMGRDNVEAAALLRRARELDPLFALAWANSANISISAGDPDEAVELARQSIVIYPGNWVGYFHLGRAYTVLGDREAALQAFVESSRHSGGNSKPVASRAYTLVELGRVDEARAVLADLDAVASERYVPPYAFAVIHAALGETDLAFASLERAVDVHDLHARSIESDGRLSGLRPDPRFESLLARCGCSRTRPGTAHRGYR